MTRSTIFFQGKMHLIKVLGLGFFTTDLWIRSLKSRSATVESFLSLSRTPQIFRRNRHRLAVQTADQRSGRKLLPLLPFSLFPFVSLFLKRPLPWLLTQPQPRPNTQKPLWIILFFFWFHLLCFISNSFHFYFFLIF